MIILLCTLSFALAEPPVGDSYLEAAQLSHDQISHQQYLPPNLTVPSARTSKSFNAFSNQYLPPSTRVITQEYGPPESRGRLSSEYGLPSSGISSLRSEISQEYGTPIARSSHFDYLSSDLHQTFSSALNPGISQRYGAPSSGNSVSNLYSTPSQRSSPSPQYGTPQVGPSNEYKTHTSPLQKYGVPSFGTQIRSKSVSQNDGKPSNSNLQPSLRYSNGYSSRLQKPQFLTSRNPSQSYGSSARSLSSQYGTPSVRNSVSRLGGSASSSNPNTNAFASSNPSARSPSLEYGTPSSRTTAPSQEYGDSLDGQGYGYTRNTLEILNQKKPANYEFAYKVNDDDTGSDFGHTENRQLDRAEGAYFVLLPDGNKQVVEYEADEDGFKPRITVEPADPETLLRAEGPY